MRPVGEHQLNGQLITRVPTNARRYFALVRAEGGTVWRVVTTDDNAREAYERAARRCVLHPVVYDSQSPGCEVPASLYRRAVTDSVTLAPQTRGQVNRSIAALKHAHSTSDILAAALAAETTLELIASLDDTEVN